MMERDRVLYGSRQGLQIGYWERDGTPVAFLIAIGLKLPKRGRSFKNTFFPRDPLLLDLFPTSSNLWQRGFHRQRGAMRYLGVPIKQGRSLIVDFKYLIDKVNRQIGSWKSRFLSKAGRLTLINAILYSMPVYLATASAIPKAILNFVDRTCAAFFWGASDGGKRRQWVTWNIIQRPILEGGLGVRNMWHVQLSMIIKLENSPTVKEVFTDMSHPLRQEISLSKLLMIKCDLKVLEDLLCYEFGTILLAEGLLFFLGVSFIGQSLWMTVLQNVAFLSLPTAAVASHLRCKMKFEQVSCSTSAIRNHIHYMVNVALENLVFKQYATPPQMALIKEFGFSYMPPVKMVRMVRWIPPLHGPILNVDGASKGNPGPCGGGGIVRTTNGTVLFTFAHFYGAGTNLLAECRAMCDGVQMALEKGVPITLISTDSLVLVNSLRSGTPPSWECVRWWRLIQEFVQQHNVEVKYVYREANQVADALANFACNVRCNGSFSSSSNLPKSCFPAIIGDRLGLTHKTQSIYEYLRRMASDCLTYHKAVDNCSSSEDLGKMQLIRQLEASSSVPPRLEGSLDFEEGFSNSGVFQKSSQKPDRGGFGGSLALAKCW
ncbi:hypothetical protein Taro_032814, partial [Colocasia esculenta]|nr:hypothetical protein [Colocasia esculenta]